MAVVRLLGRGTFPGEGAILAMPAPPSYPARVVRYLSERRHALERGLLARAAYDAEVERVFERVLDDTARGCATKILTVNALREANLCDEKTAARYVTLCVGAYRRGGAYSMDDAIEGTAIEGTAERTEDVSARRFDAEPREKTPAPPRASRTTFENTRWHLGPGGDPWAFAYDEDTHVMRELEYLAEKSRAMHERARRAAESSARAGEASSAAETEKAEAEAETRGRRVELGDAARDGERRRKTAKDADAGGAASERPITDWDLKPQTSNCEEPTRNAPSPSPEDPALEKTANASTLNAFGNVLARAATSARRAEAATRDVERFAAELEKKYPFPKVRDGSLGSVPNLEDGVLASWDDVDPRRPGEAPVPVSVHWTDVDAREGGEGGTATTATGVADGEVQTRVAEEPTEEPTEELTEELTPHSSLLPEAKTHATPSVANERPARASEDFPTRADPDAAFVAAFVRAAIARVVEKQEAFAFASREDAFAAAVPTELSRRPPKADDSANASASPPTASENESSVRRNFRRALLVGCAYFAPRRPELTRLRGALNDVEAIREVLASLYGLDADDPDRTRILIDRPVAAPKEGGSFFGGFSRKREPPSSSDAWKTGLAAPPRLTSDVPNVPNVPAEGDTPQEDVEGNDDISQNVPDSGTTAYPTDAPSRANVLAGLAWLTDGAKAGDVLFFHFSGHATQVPSSVAETGELDGADEALCTVDTDWETCVGVTEHELVRELFAKVPNGATLVASVDAKLCGALRGSATYAADDAFVEASARRLAAFPRLSEKRAQTHDEIFGRFVPPPKAVAAEIARRTAEARATQPETRRARAAAAERTRRDAREAANVVVALVGCDAAKGETCRETPCADGAVRGAFTEALCAALRARGGGLLAPLAEAEDTPKLECLHAAARDAKALAAAIYATGQLRDPSTRAAIERHAKHSSAEVRDYVKDALKTLDGTKKP